MKNLILLLFLFSCSQKETKQIESKPSIVKENQNLDSFGESTPISFNNELVLLYTDRSDTGATAKLLLKFKDHTELVAENYTLGSALVYQNEILVFGTSQDFSSIYMFRKIDNNWIQTKIIDAENEKIFNTSATIDNNKILLAYETDLNRGGSFTFKFAIAENFVFQKQSQIFDTIRYTACPTIRKIKDTYFVTYLVIENNRFITRISKSNDLINWNESKTPFLEPTENEGNNLSDVDFVEINNVVIIYYLSGDQLTWGYLRKAHYNGSLEELFNSFYE